MGPVGRGWRSGRRLPAMRSAVRPAVRLSRSRRRGDGQRGVLGVERCQGQSECEDLDRREAVDRAHPFRQLGLRGILRAPVPLPGAEECEEDAQSELEGSHPGGRVIVGGGTCGEAIASITAPSAESPRIQPPVKRIPLRRPRGVASMRMIAMIGSGLTATAAAKPSTSPRTAPMVASVGSGWRSSWAGLGARAPTASATQRAVARSAAPLTTRPRGSGCQRMVTTTYSRASQLHLPAPGRICPRELLRTRGPRHWPATPALLPSRNRTASRHPRLLFGLCTVTETRHGTQSALRPQVTTTPRGRDARQRTRSEH